MAYTSARGHYIRLSDSVCSIVQWLNTIVLQQCRKCPDMIFTVVRQMCMAKQVLLNLFFLLLFLFSFSSLPKYKGFGNLFLYSIWSSFFRLLFVLFVFIFFLFIFFFNFIPHYLILFNFSIKFGPYFFNCCLFFSLFF